MTSTIKVNNIQNQCGANIINESSNTITIGASGDTIALASGASQTGFGRTGTVDWVTTKKTASFTAVSGEGYFVDTTSAAITVTAPASPSAGDIFGIKDYAGTFNTNSVTVARNGSNFDGSAVNATLSEDNLSVFFVYVDSTQGWKATQSDAGTYGAAFVSATGGTVTTCGDFKIHTFTSPGNFCVSCAGNSDGSNTVDYLVVAGGGSGAAKGPGDSGGGGGAGGFRYSAATFTSPSCAPGHPLRSPTGLPVSVQSYPVTVGAGGSGNPAPGGSCAPNQNGANGSNSIFSTITSTGGGRGGYGAPRPNGGGFPGGSGGGAGSGLSAPEGPNTGGSGNTPPVSPPQGNNGGLFVYPGSPPNSQGAGGGGATAVGDGGPPTSLHPGGAGAGVPTAFGGCNGVANPSPDSFRYYAGGGGGGRRQGSCTTGGLGGGGGSGGPIGGSGTANTGGGGGGGAGDGNPAGGGSGGSGIVVIRYKFQ